MFAVTSTTSEGKDFVAGRSVKYVANTYAMPFANFNVDKGHFATDVQKSTSWAFRTGLSFHVRYAPVSEELVKRYALEPAMSLWDRRGGWFFLGIFVLAVFIAGKPSHQTKPN